MQPTVRTWSCPADSGNDNTLRDEEACRHAEHMGAFAYWLMQRRGALLRALLLRDRQGGSELSASCFPKQERGAGNIAVYRVTRRYPDLAALLWGIFQAGRLQPSRDILAMLRRARRYWPLFRIEAVAIGLRHASVALRRSRQPRLEPSGVLSCAPG